MEFVADDWIVHRFIPGEANVEEATEHLDFLARFYHEDNGDRIVVVRTGPFVKKFMHFLKDWERRPHVYDLLTDFFRRVFSNADKCRIEEQAMSLPEHTSQTLEHISIRKDRYLFETAMHIPNKPRLIVTVDKPLCEFLEGDDEFALELLSEFLKHYRIDLKT